MSFRVLEGLPDLAEDLVFPAHHGLEACRYSQKVVGRCLRRAVVQSDVPVLREDLTDEVRILKSMRVRVEDDFQPVAGREQGSAANPLLSL